MYKGQAHDLETTGRTTAAGMAYKTAETTWPDQPTATMARGNLAWQLGHRGEAQEHFLRAVKRFPKFAEGWNNLAFALQASGCTNVATQAARCAAALTPDRFGESELLKQEGTTSAEQCPRLLYTSDAADGRPSVGSRWRPVAKQQKPHER